MRVSTVLPAAVLALCAFVPANASVVTIGNLKATTCWMAAQDQSTSRTDLQTCTDALRDDNLSVQARAGTHVNRGIIHMYRFDYDAAAEDFARARELDPGQAEAYLNESILSLHREQAGEAVRYADISLEMATARPHIAYYIRGLANEDLGEARQAYSDLRMAASLAPEWLAPETELARYNVVTR